MHAPSGSNGGIQLRLQRRDERHPHDRCESRCFPRIFWNTFPAVCMAIHPCFFKEYSPLKLLIFPTLLAVYFSFLQEESVLEEAAVLQRLSQSSIVSLERKESLPSYHYLVMEVSCSLSRRCSHSFDLSHISPRVQISQRKCATVSEIVAAEVNPHAFGAVDAATKYSSVLLGYGRSVVRSCWRTRILWYAYLLVGIHWPTDISCHCLRWTAAATLSPHIACLHQFPRSPSKTLSPLHQPKSKMVGGASCAAPRRRRDPRRCSRAPLVHRARRARDRDRRPTGPAARARRGRLRPPRSQAGEAPADERSDVGGYADCRNRQEGQGCRVGEIEEATAGRGGAGGALLRESR